MKRIPSPLISRALEVAEKRIGMRELSKKLIVPEATIKAWQAGDELMPEFKFLTLVDILTDLSVQWDEWNPKE